MNKQLVICSTQRSGSTFLCQSFAEYGWGLPREYFIPLIRALRKNEEYDYKGSLARIGIKSTVNNVSAVKVMANYLVNIEKVLNIDSGKSSIDNIHRINKGKAVFPFDAFNEYYSDAIWIWLRRENTVKQALSRIKARKTKIYHSTDLGVINRNDHSDKTISVNDKVLDKEIFKISSENAIWKEYFDVHKITPVKISYEELAEDKSRIMSELSKKMGLIVTPSNLNSSYKKLSNDKNNSLYLKQIERLVDSVSVSQT